MVSYLLRHPFLAEKRYLDASRLEHATEVRSRHEAVSAADLERKAWVAGRRERKQEEDALRAAQEVEARETIER